MLPLGCGQVLLLFEPPLQLVNLGKQNKDILLVQYDINFIFTMKILRAKMSSGGEM